MLGYHTIHPLDSGHIPRWIPQLSSATQRMVRCLFDQGRDDTLLRHMTTVSLLQLQSLIEPLSVLSLVGSLARFYG